MAHVHRGETLAEHPQVASCIHYAGRHAGMAEGFDGTIDRVSLGDAIERDRNARVQTDCVAAVHLGSRETAIEKSIRKEVHLAGALEHFVRPRIDVKRAPRRRIVDPRDIARILVSAHQAVYSLDNAKRAVHRGREAILADRYLYQRAKKRPSAFSGA